MALDFSLAVLLLARRRRHPHRPTPWHTAHAGSPGRTPVPSPATPSAHVPLSHRGVVNRGGGCGHRYNAQRRRLRRRPLVRRQQSCGHRVPATMVDAGFEWSAATRALSLSRDDGCRSPVYDTWFDQMFPASMNAPLSRQRGFAPVVKTAGHRQSKNSGSQSARISTSTWFANLAASRTGRTRGAWLRPAVQEPE